MRLQSKQGSRTIFKSLPDRLTAHLGVPLVIAALMCSALFATAVRASTLLDPDPLPSSTYFAYANAVIGDIDGDGVPDIAVGAPFTDGDFASDNGFGTPQDVGKVWIISGANLSVITRLDDPFFQQPMDFPKFGGYFGWSVAAVGDLNHDGVPDILVGTPHHSNFNADHINAGEAFVFSGKDGSILFTLLDPNEDEGNRFGYAVAGLGDVNGDGVPDLLIGSPKTNLSEDLPDVGAAYIFSGADGSLIRELDSSNPTLSGRFGTAVASAGDVNGDGVADVLVGAPGEGRAYVLNGATGALIRTLNSPTADLLPSFGDAVAGGLDINRDGIPDFVIGAPSAGKGQRRLEGAAYVFNGADGTMLRTLRAARQAYAKFGQSVALIPDVSGDGRPDIMVGAPDHDVSGQQMAGEVFIFRGNNFRLFQSVTSAAPKAYAAFGFAITTADFNNDGTQEKVIGTPFQNADLINPMGDIETHLQIGQLEIQ